VPNKFHPSVVVPALNQGKHVWCEKPLARNPAEAIEIVQAAIGSGRFLKVGSNLRYFPSVLKAKDLLDSGAVGDVLFVRGWIGNSGWQLGSWYSDADVIGGGTFLDNGSHLLDIYRWFLGEPTECVGCISTSHWPVAPLEDNAMGIFKFASGRLAFLHSSWTEWAGYMYLEIYGREGYIRVDNRQSDCLVVLGGKNGSREVFDFSKQPPQSYDLELSDFVASVQRGRQPLPSGFDGLRAVQMAHGIYESSLSGKAIALWGDGQESLLKLYERQSRCERKP
ncbi:MAG: Gfo/Idh/MocA family oxidoreductase, partial [Chloroflexi bacterium]|nr:Gfo/Idh/MocA family oxidoreductase [Chloroflexota bacterium]